MTVKSGCDDCNKSSLSLLLLRPSPIAKRGVLVPAGSAIVGTDSVVTAGLLPARMPTESRFVLRLLRAGYVHVYLPAPPAGMKNWLVYRVTDQGDIVAHGSSWFAQPKANVRCSTEGHNAMGLKLLHIPQAHKISTLWIAYSANLWNDTLRAANKANPAVMQQISLAGGSPNTFKPDLARLKTSVLECALKSLSVDHNTDHDFQFNSIASLSAKLVENLQSAAACHPKTKGKEMAVVLGDPVGVATELNAVRLRRHQLANQELEKPANVHPLNSSNALMGLKNVMLDSNTLGSYEAVSMLKTKQQFAEGKWPAGTVWQELTPQDRKTLVARAESSWMTMGFRNTFATGNFGRVIFPDHDARAAAWARKKTEETWAKLAPHYDEKARTDWLRDFTARMLREHYAPLARYEEDWRGATTDPKLLACFSSHFDARDPNDPKKAHSPGCTYAREVNYIHAPAPFTQGKLTDDYVAMLDMDIKDPKAVVLRAVAANQAEIIDVIYKQSTGDAGADGMRDLTFDFAKGLSETTKGKAVIRQYSWLGDGLGMFSVGLLSSFSGAIMSAAARHPQIQASTTRALGKIQGLWAVQQGLEMLVQGAVQGSGGGGKVPVLVRMRVSADAALQILQARTGQGVGLSKTRIKKAKANGAKITLTILTDTETLRLAGGNLDSLVRDPTSGQVKMGKPATSVTMNSARGRAVILTETQFLDIFSRNATRGSKAVEGVRKALSGASAKDLRAITMSLEGRLAIGGVIAEGIGLINAFASLGKAKEASELRDSWYGIYDSTAGMLGGLLQMWAVAVDVRTVSQAGGTVVAAKSIGLAALRFSANIAGAAGGVVNMLAAWAKADDATAAGDHRVATLYKFSGYSFAGTVATSAAMAAGIGADTLIARGVTHQVVRTIAVRVGANGVLAMVGGTALTVSGIGLVLLGAGIAFQVGAIALTPTPMQRWISRSYFGVDPSMWDWDGKRDDMFPKGDWPKEFAALQEAIKTAGKDDAPEPAKTAAPPPAPARPAAQPVPAR